MDTLTIKQVQEAFEERVSASGRKGVSTTLQIANGLAGKVGKLSGSAKFEDRGDPTWNPGLEGPFLADVIGYAVIYANHRGIDLAAAIRKKFNEDSAATGSSVQLGTEAAV